MKKLIISLLLGLIVFSCAEESEEDTAVELEDSLVAANIKYTNKATEGAINIACLDCSFFLSGGTFPVDSVLLDGSMYHVVDLTFGKGLWVPYFPAQGGSAYYECSYEAQSNPCGDIVTANILDFLSIIAVHPEYGLVAFDSSAQFLSKGVLIDIKDLSVVIND